MITLCLETATARVAIAITNNGRLIGETLLDAPGGQQNRLLLPELQHLLNLHGLEFQQIDLYSCAVGPGSFTGLRSGIATIQGLALANNKPCVGVSTLAMLALNLPYAAFPVCPMLDARKNEVYTALYQPGALPDPICPDHVILPEQFLAELEGPVIFLGDGAVKYHSLIVQKLGERAVLVPASLSVVRASAGCMLAEDTFSKVGATLPEQLLPNYLRLSEAELARQKGKGGD
jgi:tRNA threonylcarbamoyladenosine biosynthesis protein TsaB